MIRSAAGYVRGYVVRAKHAGMTPAPVLRRDLPPETPDNVDDPKVEKASGVVVLPQRVDRSSPADV